MRKRMKPKDRQAIVIFIVLGLITIGSFFLMYKLESAKVKLDEKTLCPLNREINHHTIVVIDKSDEWEQENIHIIERLLSNIHSTIPEFGQLTFVVVSGEKGAYTKAVKLFDMCNPGNGDNANRLFTNPRQLKKRYETSFAQPLREIMKKLVEPGQSSSSPLFETIVGLIDQNYSKYLEIHLVSDLMENGSKFRFYDAIPLSEQVIREYPVYTKARVEIHAHTIERRRHSRGLMDAVENVWLESFLRQGVQIDFKRLLITE